LDAVTQRGLKREQVYPVQQPADVVQAFPLHPLPGIAHFPAEQVSPVQQDVDVHASPALLHVGAGLHSGGPLLLPQLLLC
jgi:hypothetical protein